ncbi:MAG TPA: hypothetical protein VLA61_06525 [Ideonella sp.]|uniref:hypothetical protein n=1 Tax=Ideonella sp. TaxID=1929293 RepID=UPI002BF35D57|nr:hypothetical protein [Ideonella sp.]HSI47904.1 hypothetical protein [Ideonella sp.]
MTRRPVLAATPSTTFFALLASVCLMSPVLGHAQVKAGFAPNEAQASTRKDLIDSEFSPSRNMFTWCDSQGRLWLGTIDPATGNILKPTYKLLDEDAITTKEMLITTNGPEWVSTATGDHVVYTKFVGTPSADTAQLALVEGSADGTTWSAPQLLGAGNAPYASDDEGDPSPRISYVNAASQHLWRYLYDDASAKKVKGMTATKQPVSVRFVKGDNSLVYAQKVKGGSKQVFKLALDDSKDAVQLTFDEGDKDTHTVPWMWRAPEYNNKLVLMTTVNENELRFYKGDGNGNWAVVNSVTMPAGTVVRSPEPFTYDGKSYVSLAVKSDAYGYPTAIYIAAVSPNAKTKLWKVSDDTDLHERSDPEVFVTANGPVVFYNKYDPSQMTGDQTDPARCSACSEGLFRAASGL